MKPAFTSDTESEISLSQSLELQIHKLRAYAAIVAGGKVAGDQAIQRAISKMIRDNAGFHGEPGFDFQSFLFKLIDTELAQDAGTVCSLDRKIHVLMELEGLSISEIAHILGLSPLAVSARLEERPGPQSGPLREPDRLPIG